MDAHRAMNPQSGFRATMSLLEEHRGTCVDYQVVSMANHSKTKYHTKKSSDGAFASIIRPE